MILMGTAGRIARALDLTCKTEINDEDIDHAKYLFPMRAILEVKTMTGFVKS